MTTEDVQQELERVPFVPLRLHLASGQKIDILYPNAAWVRQNTPPDAVFAVADEHNSPIPTLAGRRVMSGFQGWLWTYGLRDYQQKSTDEVAILRGAQNTPDLVDRYGVTYVLIGPQELAQPRGASQGYWQQHGKLVYSNQEYSVYKV